MTPGSLNVVDAVAKSEAVSLLFAGVDVVELDVVVEALLAEGDGVVDLHRFWELSVRFEVPVADLVKILRYIKCDILHNAEHCYAECHYGECPCAECHTTVLMVYYFSFYQIDGEKQYEVNEITLRNVLPAFIKIS